MRGVAIVLAITRALALSGIAAPVAAQAGRIASTPYGCDPSDGSYPGYAPPYAYAAYYYGYPPDCGDTSIYFYFAPAYYGHRYGGSRYFHHWHHGWHRHLARSRSPCRRRWRGFRHDDPVRETFWIIATARGLNRSPSQSTL